MLIVLVSLLGILAIVKNYDEYKIMNKMLVSAETLLNIITIAFIIANKINISISILISNIILLELSQYIYYNSSPRDSTILKYFLYINKLAGADEIFIDRYEDGGIGSKNSSKLGLKPSNDQFREALTKIINVRNMNLISKESISFGTAIPFCVDSRLFEENLLSFCGAGLDFCAVNPDGELRICNQSEHSYGNIFDKDIDEIWNDRNLNSYRDYSWLSEPCKSCKLVDVCQAGCRVDANCGDDYCVDYAVRENIDKEILDNIDAINRGELKYVNVENNRLDIDLNNKYLCISDYLKVNEYKDEIYMVTRYQGVNIGQYEYDIISYLLETEIFTLDELYSKFKQFDNNSIQNFG